jgi:lysozyme
MWELRTICFPSATRLCPKILEWGAPATGALLDFVYNLGSGNLAASTLRKRILANDKDGAKIELKRWVRGGGKVLPGLVRRRTAEAEMLG